MDAKSEMDPQSEVEVKMSEVEVKMSEVDVKISEVDVESEVEVKMSEVEVMISEVDVEIEVDVENETSPKETRGRKRKIGTERTISIYAVQCEECHKWRKTDSYEEYEEIRSRLKEEPFVCEKKVNSCEDDTDLNYNDSTQSWVIDKPGLPKTPTGFTRSVVMRTDYTRPDAYYITSCGKKLRTLKEVGAFIEASQDYKDVPLTDFDFTVPKVLDPIHRPRRLNEDE